MNRFAILLLALCPALCCLAAPASATAYLPSPNDVTPLDTFSFAVYGSDNNGSGAYSVQSSTATFGTTQTFTSTSYGGNQPVTFTSSSSYSGGIRTDTFTVTSSNFIVPGQLTPAGTAFVTLELDLGGLHASDNPIDFSTPVNSPTFTGSADYGNGKTLALNDSATSNSTFTNGNQSLVTEVAVESIPNDISAYNVHSFTFSISYPDAVPEPSTNALLGVAGIALGVLCWRRRALRV